MEKKPHKHAEVIRAWADGTQIEYRSPLNSSWVLTEAPAFAEDYEYRVKPAREYPKSMLSPAWLCHTYDKSAWLTPEQAKGLHTIADEAIRYAIDNGQVVTREEFKRVSDEANKAVRSLNAYGYTDEGGDLWKPPLGPRHISLDERATRDLAVSIAVRDKCRDLTVKHAMRSGVVHDIERLDLFAIIDAVNG